MSTEANKAVVRRFFDALNENRLDVLASDLLSPNCVLRFDGNPPMDSASAVEFHGAFLAAFPGIHHTIEDQIAEGEWVVTRITVQGTQQGELMGIPPTGKQITVGAINMHRIVDGKIVEQRVMSDALGMLQQLGVIPAPGQQPA